MSLNNEPNTTSLWKFLRPLYYRTHAMATKRKASENKGTLNLNSESQIKLLQSSCAREQFKRLPTLLCIWKTAKHLFG